MNDYELKKEILSIINQNCTEVPYEGTEIDKDEIVDDMMNLVKRLTPTLYYIKSDYGYGDSSIIASNLTEDQALEIYNEQTGADHTVFEYAYYDDHPTYEIRQIGY